MTILNVFYKIFLNNQQLVYFTQVSWYTVNLKTEWGLVEWGRKKEKIKSKLLVHIISWNKLPLLEVKKKMNNTVVPYQWLRPSFFRSWAALLITWRTDTYCRSGEEKHSLFYSQNIPLVYQAKEHYRQMRLYFSSLQND